MDSVDIVVVAGNSDLREALALSLCREYPGAGIRALGDAGTLMSVVGEMRPRVVIIDCAPPRPDGFATSALIARLSSELRVLLLMPDSRPINQVLAEACGASRWVSKSRIDLDLMPALRILLHGSLTSVA